MAFRYNKYGVIVSIDFGTTFSGTCYSITGKFTPKELEIEPYVNITHVTDWPSQSFYEHKTPSIVIYDRNFNLLYWGKEAFIRIRDGPVKKDEIVMEKFKLNLPSSVTQKGAIYQTGNITKEELLNMRATIDYFREIYDHTVSTIQNDIGFIRESKIEEEDIRFVITVPAQWNDVQRAIMRNVAKEAGLISDEDHENRLLLINESLAAALYCERKYIKRLHIDEEDHITYTAYGNGLNAHDKYMICDAGGGTVNLATFECTELGGSDENDRFGHCQLTVDSDDMCGSVFLDEQMQKLLLSIFFGLDEPQNDKEKEAQKKYEKLIEPYITEFINEQKIAFGLRSPVYEFKCTHINKDGHLPINNDECVQCINEEYKWVEDNKFCDATELEIDGGQIVRYLNPADPPRSGVQLIKDKWDDVTGISISYELMRKEVFDQVIESTLGLLKRQIDKANGNIKRTYLVGGFGRSPYLQLRVRKRFTNEETGECLVGELVTDNRGDTAAMRGAMYYGIDSSRIYPQPPDTILNDFETGKDQFNTLVCLDIGYNGTACCYRDLNSTSEDMKEVTHWPGLDKDNFLIPTALDTSDGEPLWGAQVSQTTNLEPETLIVPSKLMAIVKSDFRTYLTEYLKLLHNHIHNVISDENPHLADKSKYRYVITMENCYRFFNSKSDMRKIAISAGIIGVEDSVERLLLIHRENAAAMYYETKYFSVSETKAYSNHFLQINMYHDACHLSLHEAIRINGYHNEEEADAGNIALCRNVRSLKSATVDFDFVGNLVACLRLCTFKYASLTCSLLNNAHTHISDKNSLAVGLTDYIKDTLDFEGEYDLLQCIYINDCCKLYISLRNMIENVFEPAIRNLATEMNRCAIRSGISYNHCDADKIFLVSSLISTSKKINYSFLEAKLVNILSQCLSIAGRAPILLSRNNRKEALLGAALYGNRPSDFTERVSRKSYIVNVRAFAPKEFSLKLKDEIAKLKTKNEKYDFEAVNALINESQEVELYYQSACNPSLKNDKLRRSSRQATFLIHRGDKITEKDQMNGISKRFYAERECIVYATIYTSEMIDLPKPEDEINVDLSKFQKIHQFEIYVKRDADDPMTRAPNSRLHFDVRVIPDKDEAKFEAKVCPRLRKTIPEFHFRDEILVANIYGDEELTRTSDVFDY